MEITRKKVRALRRLYQSEKDNNKKVELKIKIKKERASYKRLVLKTKSDAFKTYLDSINKSDLYGSAYKIIKDKFKVNCLCDQILKEDGTSTDNYYDYKKITLENYYYSNTVLDVHNSYNGDCNSNYNNNLNIIEIEWAVKGMKTNKVAGHDGVTAEIVKYIYDINPDLFYKIINGIWYNSKIPSIWKITKVCLIPKYGKDLVT